MVAARDESRRDIPVPGIDEVVPSCALMPPTATAMLTLAHGAGAGMDHPFMATLASRLADAGIATLRFEFPYRAAGRRRPDKPATATACVRAATALAAKLAPGLPHFAGGKSYGGRMSSHAAAQESLDVCGIVFFGFPLHAPGMPSVTRADHLDDTGDPLLFLQGDRDRLADLARLEPVIRRLGSRATLHVVAGADHGFHVLKRCGRTDADVLQELAATTAAWMARHGR